PAYFERELNTWKGSALGLEHTMLQSAMFRPRNLSRRLGNLLFAGASTTPGNGIPLCLISAELVIKRLMGDVSTAPLATPLERGFLAQSRRRGVLGDLVRSVEVD